MVGLAGAEGKLPGEISGGMRKRAGLARALVLDPQIILCDEPDSGLDPVRTAYLSQLLIDLNAQIDATMLIVTHNIDIAAHRARQHRHAVPPRTGHVRSARGAAHQRRAGGRAVPQRPRATGPSACPRRRTRPPSPPEASARRAPRRGVRRGDRPAAGAAARAAAARGPSQRRRERVMGMLDTLPRRRALRQSGDTYAAARRGDHRLTMPAAGSGA